MLYLLPLAGPAVAADLDVSLTINGQQTPLEFCSRSCRIAADTHLLGGEELDVDVKYGPSDDVATFEVPTLPPADGTDLLSLAQIRMHALQSYAIDETLGPADPPIQTHYVEVAPDKTSIASSNGYEMTWFGTTRYSRRAPSDAWSVEDVGSTLAVPMFVWDPRPADQLLSPQIIGDDSFDGQDTRVLAFYMALGQSPFWFRLWVDDTGLVLKADMRGRGHFMDQRFSGFDSGLTVVPPG
jgi:hypothetical protein